MALFTVFEKPILPVNLRFEFEQVGKYMIRPLLSLEWLSFDEIALNSRLSLYEIGDP
jgi:hypothetical protein